MNKKQTLERQERNALEQELVHCEEFLRDYDRLNYVLKNGRNNVYLMSKEERKQKETHIQKLKERLGIV